MSCDSSVSPTENVLRSVVSLSRRHAQGLANAHSGQRPGFAEHEWSVLLRMCAVALSSATLTTADDAGRAPSHPVAKARRGLRSHRVHLIGFAFVAVFIGNCAGVSSSDSSTNASGLAEPQPITASAEIGDQVYPFRPSSCLAKSNEFLAEGPGTNGQHIYYVTVAQDEISIRVGASSAADDGDHDLPAWEAMGEPDLKADGATIIGSATFVDARGDLTEELDGRIEVTCAESQ